MANILDIFRTHTGEKLLKRSIKKTGVEKKELEKAFIMALPSLLSSVRKTRNFDSKSFHLVEYIEKEDLVKSGKSSVENFLNTDELNKLLECSVILEIEKETFEKVIHISAGILSVIITQMNKETNQNDTAEILRSLSGLEVTFDQAFINTLIKDEERPNFINSAEKIALGKDKDDNDQSILGGYTGGR